MSLARALTRRPKRTEVPPPSPPARSQSVKSSTLHFDRSKISLPVALVSTTNMLSYNAPDIAKSSLRQPCLSTASTHSADDSDHSASTSRSRASTVGSRDTLTDASSIGSSPTSPARNHLSAYFPASGSQVEKSASTASPKQVKEDVAEPIPAIPQRAVSHSKRAHERLAAQRSMSNIGSRSSNASLRNSREQRTSVDMFSSTITEEAHPFGPELEQLNEIAEEFGGVIRDAEAEADVSVMRLRNLAVFCAADYLSEIQPLFNSRFGLPQAAPAMAWI
ncbi:hypothetical protein ACEQ8H_000765 [Pleosporales sp. CAS-2024a]